MNVNANMNTNNLNTKECERECQREHERAISLSASVQAIRSACMIQAYIHEEYDLTLHISPLSVGWQSAVPDNIVLAKSAKPA